MHICWRSVGAALAFVATTTTARAQSPLERVALLRWDDSLQRDSTAPSLLAAGRRAGAEGGAAGDVRVALFQLRQGVVTSNRGEIELGLIRLDAVAAAHHDWPWPEFAMAREFFRLNADDAPGTLSAGMHTGELHVEAAWRHAREAMKIDPEFLPAHRMVISLMLAEGDRELLGDEESVLRDLMARPRPPASAFVIAGRDLRRRGDPRGALAMFDRAAAGADTATVDLERAHTLHALGDTAGARVAYWDGTRHMTAEGREMYRFDLAWILPPDTLALFNAVPDDSVNGWLHDFWNERDAAAANRPGERLQEQLRRWDYAFAHFRDLTPWRRTQFKNRVEYLFEGMDRCVAGNGEFYDLLQREQPSHPGDPRRHEALLDHRGLIYLRHGTPFRQAYSPGIATLADTIQVTGITAGVPTPGSGPTGTQTPPSNPDYCIKNGADSDSGWSIGPNEGWLYWIDGEWRLLNFRGSCYLGRYGATTLTSYLPPSKFTLGDYMARGALLATYAAAARRLEQPPGATPVTCTDELQAVIAEARADADKGIHTDSDTPLITRPWDAVIAAYALGSGADQSGEALVNFSIPLDSLHLTTDSIGRRYPLTARITGYDRVTHATFAIDTVRRFIAPPAGPHGRSLGGWFELALDPGDWEIGVRLNQGVDSIGAYALAGHLVIPGRDTLSLSDIVVGADNGGDWTAPDGALFPVSTLRAWPAGSKAELYVELRGVPPGAGYAMTIGVRSVDAPGKDLVQLAESDRGAPNGINVVRRTLGLDRLKPGVYQLTVSIDAGAKHVAREQRIVVVKAPSPK
ncbi:MAG TPA: hypothetical protein VGM20_01980 [Gemmatimonadales bacterium]|jgi:hypothetical protein